jgi:hypothetical protein
MKHRKRQGVLLGLLAALSLLAFSASAQALTPQFVYKNTEGTEVAVLLGTIAAEQLGRGTLSIPGLNAEINCEKFSVQTGSEILTATDADAVLLYEECTALSITPTLVELSGCEVVTPENETLGGGPHHITAGALILPAELTNGEPALLAEKIEAKVVFHKELGCVLPILTKITGELCIKIDKNETTTPELLTSEAIQGECKERPTLEALTEGAGVKDELLYGTQKSFVTAKADVKLTGAHAGYTLGVLLK